MSQTVNIPGFGTLNFPDGMSQPDMAAAIQKNFPQIHNPGITKQPGYTASDTGQFIPLAPSVKQADGRYASTYKPPEEGNAALGALQGLYNSAMGAAGGMTAGAAAVLAPHKDMQEASDTFDKTQQFLQQNQIGPSQDTNTEAARQAVQGAVNTVAGAPQAIYDAGVNKIGSYAQKLPWAPAMNRYINSSPTLQKIMAATQGAGDVAANIALPAAVGGTAKLATSGAVDALTPLKQANQLGYSVMPSEAAIKGGSSPIGKLVEGLAGSAKTGVSAVMKNQPVTNRLAAIDVSKTAPDLGITPNTELTPQVLDKARAPNNAVYAKVASLGSIPTDDAYKIELSNMGRTPGNSFPGAADPDIQKLVQTYNVQKFDAADAVLQIRNLRKNATANYKASAANQVKNAPMLGELADAQQSIADALENQLDRYVGSPADKIGNPKLIADWRQARKNLAIINTVDNSIKEGTTDVSAEGLAKQLNRGAPLSGNLQKIADMQNNFPISIRDVTRVRNKVPINALEGIMGTAGLGSAILGEPHLGAGLVAGMVARPVARTALLSKFMQDSMLPSNAKIDPMLLKLLAAGAPAALNSGNQ